MPAALTTLRSHPYGFLTTVGSSGPHARLVQHLRVDEDAAIWIGTSPRSRKVSDVLTDPAVAYAVEDRAAFAYASVQGVAQVVDDPDLRRQLGSRASRRSSPRVRTATTSCSCGWHRRGSR